MAHAKDGGGMQRHANTMSPDRGGPAALMVGGLLLAGIAVSHVLKSATDERSLKRAHEPAEPPPDPELGAWG